MSAQTALERTPHSPSPDLGLRPLNAEAVLQRPTAPPALGGLGGPHALGWEGLDGSV